MADSYFAGFDLITRDASGVEIPLVNFELTIRYSGGADITTVDSDDNGFVPSALLTGVDPLSAIEFYDDGGTAYAGVLGQVTEAIALDAAINNKLNRFIIDDAYGENSETLLVDIYLQDFGAGAEAQHIGTVTPGETLYYPYESAKDKALRIYKVERDSESARRVTDLSLADYVDLAPARSVEDEIGVDVTAVSGGTIGNFFYHKTGHVLGEYTPAAVNINERQFIVFLGGHMSMRSGYGLQTPSFYQMLCDLI